MRLLSFVRFAEASKDSLSHGREIIKRKKTQDEDNAGSANTEKEENKKKRKSKLLEVTETDSRGNQNCASLSEELTGVHILMLLMSSQSIVFMRGSC